MCLLADSEHLAGDDQRAIAFLATHDSPPGVLLPTVFPVTSDPTLLSYQREFQIASVRKHGSLMPILEPYIGARVRSNGKSRPMYVDPYGNGIASAPGVPGDHFRRLHDRVVADSSSTSLGERWCILGGTFPDNPLEDRVSLFEHKTLASRKLTGCRSIRVPNFNLVNIIQPSFLVLPFFFSSLLILFSQ